MKAQNGPMLIVAVSAAMHSLGFVHEYCLGLLG